MCTLLPVEASTEKLGILETVLTERPQVLKSTQLGQISKSITYYLGDPEKFLKPL